MADDTTSSGESKPAVPPTTPTDKNPLLHLPEDMIPDSWRDHARDLRKENKRMREESERLANERAELTAAHERKLAELKSAADQRIMRAELRAHAIKAGIVDVDGLQLADLSGVKIKDDGTIEGAEATIEALKKSKPYLFASSTSNPANPPKPDDKTAKKFSELTEAEQKREYAKLGIKI